MIHKSAKYVLLITVGIVLLAMILTVSIYWYYAKRVEKFESLQIIERKDFDCYIINLKKNIDRLEDITTIYNSSDLSPPQFIRIEAVNGREIDIRPYVSDRVYNGILEIDKTGARLHHSQITRGAVGCYLSHLEIYKRFDASNKPYALIIEDDASFNKDIYNEGIRNIMQNIPSDWDIILLGKIDRDVVDHKTYLEMREFWGTHGYLINKSGVQKMLKYGNIPIDDQIDAVMGRLAREGFLKIYAPMIQYIPTNTKYAISDVQIDLTEKPGIDPSVDPFKK
jgi:GR25 family glycosyltransferase involved in LPS biosynthesis